MAVTAVELGAGLAAVARRRLASFPSAEVLTISFEDWEPGMPRWMPSWPSIHCTGSTRNCVTQRRPAWSVTVELHHGIAHDAFTWGQGIQDTVSDLLAAAAHVALTPPARTADEVARTPPAHYGRALAPTPATAAPAPTRTLPAIPYPRLGGSRRIRAAPIRATSRSN